MFTSSGGISAVGNITGGNIAATNHTGTTVSVTGTITGASVVGGVITGTSVSVTGNITGGNILGGANVNATTHTGSTVSVTGAITGASVVGGVITGSSVSVTGNVSGGNLIATTFIGNYSGTTASITGNINGGNLRTAGLVSATGSITGAANTGTSLTVSTGNIAGGNIVNNNANGVGNIGSATTYFNTVFAKATSAQYADLAELYTADAKYEPGTVVEFGGTAEVTLSNKAGSTRVAGVVSTNPSYIMNASLQAEHVATVALQGRVPCKVIGPVSKGDMMVAAGGGYAKVDNNAKAGTIIGKALEVLHTPYGVIEVVVGRN